MTYINFDDYCSFVSNLDEQEKMILGDDYSSCWLFAYYFHKLYNLPILNNECIYETIIEDISEFKLDVDGIYSCFLEHDDEFHHFILIVHVNNVDLLSTYGGQSGYLNARFDKHIFIEKLTNIFNHGYVTEYMRLFQIKRYKTKGFIKNITLSYSLRPF